MKLIYEEDDMKEILVNQANEECADINASMEESNFKFYDEHGSEVHIERIEFEAT